jgi:signal peptidase II
MLKFLATLWPVGLGVVLVAVDQLTKFFVLRAWPGLLFANENFAFSLPLRGWVLGVVLATASVLLLWFLVHQWQRFTSVERLAWVLVCAGGLGNIIDRLWLGYVRDFLHVGTGVINLADIFIFGGAALLIIIAFSPRRAI